MSTEYLESVLESQAAPELVLEMLRTRRELLESALSWGWDCGKPRFYYGGSLGKKTLIASSFDLDLVMYFPCGTRAGLGEIFERVEGRLRREGHAAVRHNVAIRLQYVRGFHVDVVPGIAVDESYEFARLWACERQCERVTSIRRHIAMVRESGQRDVIRLLKLWKHLHRAPAGSFVLELAAVSALRGAGGDLAERFGTALRFLRDRIMEARLVDPANADNVISDQLDYGAKLGVAKAAAMCCDARIEEVVW